MGKTQREPRKPLLLALEGFTQLLPTPPSPHPALGLSRLDGTRAEAGRGGDLEGVGAGGSRPGRGGKGPHEVLPGPLTEGKTGVLQELPANEDPDRVYATLQMDKVNPFDFLSQPVCSSHSAVPCPSEQGPAGSLDASFCPSQD